MSLLFDADTEVVNCGSAASLDGLDVFSVAAVVNRSVNNFNQVILGKGTWNNTGWSLLCDDNNGSLRFILVRTGGFTVYKAAIGSIALDEWTYVGVTFDEAASPRAHLYYAPLGEPVVEEASYQTEQDGTGTIVSGDGQNFEIGLQTSGGNNNWDGRLARVGFYPSVLPLNAQKGLPGASIHGWKRSGAVGLWELDGTGTLTDYSGNENHGVITGATPALHAPFGPVYGSDAGLALEAAVAVGGGELLQIPHHLAGGMNRMHGGFAA